MAGVWAGDPAFSPVDTFRGDFLTTLVPVAGLLGKSWAPDVIFLVP